MSSLNSDSKIKVKDKCIGIISDISLHRHLLQSALMSANYKVKYIHDPDKKELKNIPFDTIDVWLVDLSDEDEWEDLINEVLENTDAPVLFGEDTVPQHGTPAFNRWKKRLLKKINEYIGPPLSYSQAVDDEEAEVKAGIDGIITAKKPTKVHLPKEFDNQSASIDTAQRVWVLAASLGGPAAVKEFLEYIPTGLPVAFILAQHIDGGFQKVLSQVLERNTEYNIITECENKKVIHGNIYVLSVEYSVTFSASGVILSNNEPWEGPYSPSIDQTVGAVADRWRGQSGVIVFSGMGEDGTKTVPIMYEYGGLILAQDEDSCANSSMPDAIRDTGCVSFNGSPQQLAYQFVDLIRKQLAVAS